MVPVPVPMGVSWDVTMPVCMPKRRVMCVPKPEPEPEPMHLLRMCVGGKRQREVCSVRRGGARSWAIQHVSMSVPMMRVPVQGSERLRAHAHG